VTITAIIPGKPVGKGRPRFTKGGTPYTPEKTRAYETKAAIIYKLAARGYKFPRHVPVSVTIRAFYGVPASDTKRQRERKLTGAVLPCKKPDIDNVTKIILDALNGLAYEDDAQVVKITAEKFYSDRPRVEISVSASEEADTNAEPN
jgi:Holliday junction resolvase RusA-like endonuclease